MSGDGQARYTTFTLHPAQCALLPATCSQALVAEVAGYKSESLDLLRHCTSLGLEQESARGYRDAVTGNLILGDAVKK